MPNKLETAAELNKMLSDGIALWATPLDIVKENVSYSEVLGKDYIRTLFIPYVSTNVTLGSQRRIRTNGVLQIRIRSGADIGIGKAYGYADLIEEMMENKNPISNLFTYAVDTRRLGEGSDGWFTLLCDVPFTSDKT